MVGKSLVCTEYQSINLEEYYNIYGSLINHF